MSARWVKLVKRQQLNTVGRFVPLAKFVVDSFDDRVRDHGRTVDLKARTHKRSSTDAEPTDNALEILTKMDVSLESLWQFGKKPEDRSDGLPSPC